MEKLATVTKNVSFSLMLNLPREHAVALMGMMQNPMRPDESDVENELRQAIFTELAARLA